MDFTAIDFETATSLFTSACSLGWCVVKDNVIISRREILIRPEPFEFNKNNIRIHGIKPEMVENMPTFDKYWDMLKKDIENKMIVAHNASFDVRVLCSTLQMYGIELPSFRYMCTVKLSQKAYPELDSHKLNKLFVRHIAAEFNLFGFGNFLFFCFFNAIRQTVFFRIR